MWAVMPVLKRMVRERVPMLFRILVPVLLLASFPVGAGEAGPTRVQVIAPAMPRMDEFVPLTLVARTGAGEIDRDYTGDVWLWTDGPWIRPFHVRFAGADQGVIRLPVKLERAVLQRIEAYDLGGVAHTWSNPVRPVERDYDGPRLLWGALDGSKELGLDFILGGEEEREVTELERLKEPRNAYRPTRLPALTRKFKHETWQLLLNPALPPDDRKKLALSIGAAEGNSQLLPLITERAGDVLLVRAGVTPEESIETPPYILMIDAAAEETEVTKLISLRVLAVVAGPAGLIGVWSQGDDAASIWRALKSGAAYAAWGSRIMVDVTASPGGGLRGTIAGQGPREVLSVLRLEGKKSREAWRQESDSDRIELDFRDPKAGPTGCFFLQVREPGSPHDGRAWAILGGMRD